AGPTCPLTFDLPTFRDCLGNLREAPGHQPDRAELHHRLAHGRQPLVVLREPGYPPSHANVRSTTHRFGSTANHGASRRTSESAHPNTRQTRHAADAALPSSENTARGRATSSSSRSWSWGARWLSWASSGWTITARSLPSVFT